MVKLNTFIRMLLNAWYQTSGNDNQQQPIRTIVQYKLGRGREMFPPVQHLNMNQPYIHSF